MQWSGLTDTTREKELATALTEARAEIERRDAQVDEALRSCLAEREGRLKAESELSTLRARVREVVGPLIALTEDFKVYGPAVVAARQLNEDLK